jgi:hypothetical protein
MPDIEYLSLANLDSFTEELVGFDPKADANALPKPFPAGEYVVTVTHLEEDPTKIWERKITERGQVYLNTSVIVEIADNPHNPKELVGQRRTVRNVMTLVMQNTGTTGVQALLQALGRGKDLENTPQTHANQAKLLSAALASKPICVWDTDWEARVYNKSTNETEFELRGMKRFPPDPTKPGEYLPETVYRDKNGSEVTVPAFNYHRRWRKLEDLGKGRATSTAATTAPAQAQVPTAAAPKPGAAATPKATAPQATAPQAKEPQADKAKEPEPATAGGGKK